MSERMNLRWSMAEMGAKTGEIKIYSAISDYEGWDEKNPNATSQQFDKELKALGDVDTLNIRINSPGGLVNEAVAIRAMLIAHPAKKEITIEGNCLSAATLIACIPGAHVKIAKGSLYMIHQPRVGAWGTVSDMLDAYNYLKKIEEDVADIYAERTGATPEEMREAMTPGTWYRAQEAVNAGFADEVIGEKEAAACVTPDMWRAMAEMYGEIPQEIEQTAGETADPETGDREDSDGETAVATGDPAENNNGGMNMDEIRSATAEQLRQENPSAVNDIVAEALRMERERIQQIDELTPPGAEWQKAAAEAKASGMSAQDFFKTVLRKQRESGENYMQARQRETAPAAQVTGGAAEDNDPAGMDVDAVAEEIAGMAKGMNTVGGMF